MQIVRSNEELRHARAQMAGSVALVPTMGALHRGHLALIEKAKSSADTVAATIFVNPTQFGPSEDLSRYPRQEALDCEMLENAGCDLVWIPSVEDIYPHGFSTSIHVGEVSERWEGEARAGHFDGVATIVTKLLLSVRPNVALFGEKDFQQLAVIRRFVSDLNIDVTISAAKTVREDDGLALSSRNAYLSHDERIRAGALYQSLLTARDAIRSGQSVQPVLEGAREALHWAGFSKIDYFALVDAASLEPLSVPQEAARLIAAAVIGTTRLIDNLEVPKIHG